MPRQKLYGLIGKAFTHDWIDTALKASAKALKLDSRPTPVISFQVLPRGGLEYHVLNFSYPQFGLNFILKPKSSYKLLGMNGEQGELSSKEDDYDLHLLEVLGVSVFNGQDGRKVEVTFRNQVVQFSPFPLDIAHRHYDRNDGVMDPPRFFSIKSTDLSGKITDKIREAELQCRELSQDIKDEGSVAVMGYEMCWGESPVSTVISFEKKGGKEAFEESYSEEDRWIKYALFEFLEDEFQGSSHYDSDGY